MVVMVVSWSRASRSARQTGGFHSALAGSATPASGSAEVGSTSWPLSLRLSSSCPHRRRRALAGSGRQRRRPQPRATARRQAGADRDADCASGDTDSRLTTLSQTPRMASGACGHSGLAAPRRHALLLPAPAAPPCVSQRAARRRNTARLACAGASGLEFSHPPPPRHHWTTGVGAQVVSSCLVRCRLLSWLKPIRHDVRVQTSSVDLGAGSYEGDEAGGRSEQLDISGTKSSNEPAKPVSGSRYMQAIAAVLLLCALASAFIVFFKGQPSAVVAALAKSGFTAAFTLIFVSEIGDKTFFIAALLAMQYQKALVLLGSMAALSLMTIVSVVIGRIFQSVPAQFQTTLPIGEYAAVALLAFFGFKSIKDAWALPDKVNGDVQENSESGELAEAEELVKEKASLKITSPLAILWKSFSLVFFAEWGDRSMLATIALGAAQSPLGVASGAIAGHLVATLLAIIGGAFLANYLSEKLVGLLGGVLFLLFAAATLFGVF